MLNSKYFIDCKDKIGAFSNEIKSYDSDKSLTDVKP